MSPRIPVSTKEEITMTELCNQKKLRSSIRRMFTGETSELISELLQNAQRAEATRIDFDTKWLDGKIIVNVRDNGIGVFPTIEAWHRVLSLGDNGWSEDVIINQNPMGIGIHAVLAQSHVEKVTMRSRGVTVEIDTNRWWEDETYYENWRSLLHFSDTAKVFEEEDTPGFELEYVSSESKLQAAYTSAFHGSEIGGRGVAEGYQNYLLVFHDGDVVKTRVNDSARITEPLATTKYADCELRIGDRSSGTVNWYGQLITVRDLNCFGFYLEVNHGTPVTPMSPSRRGLIKNEQLNRLEKEINDLGFKSLASLPAKDINPSWVQKAFNIDPDRARSLPHFLAREVNAAREIWDSDDVDRLGEFEVLGYEDTPEVLLFGIEVIEPVVEGEADGEMVQYDEGLRGFAQMAQAEGRKIYVADHYDERRLKPKTVYWRRGELYENSTALCKPGEYQICAGEPDPNGWRPVTGDVFAANGEWDWFGEEMTFVVGTDNPRGWFNGPDTHAGFRYNDGWDQSRSEAEACYERLLEDEQMAMFPECLRRDYTTEDLQRKAGNGDRVMTVEFRYKSPASPVVDEVIVAYEKGGKKSLRLL